MSPFWQGFEFGPSAHSMLIAAVGSLMGEVISAMNSYRHNKRMPIYYKKKGFWVVRLLVVIGASLVPWLQGMKDAGVDRFVPFEIGLCAELIISHVANQH